MAEDREYWLGHCEGFDVRAGGRHVGIVEYVRYGSAHDHPDAVFALTGTFRTRVLEVPVDAVEALDPEDETLWISDALAATEAFAPPASRRTSPACRDGGRGCAAGCGETTPEGVRRRRSARRPRCARPESDRPRGSRCERPSSPANARTASMLSQSENATTSVRSPTGRRRIHAPLFPASTGTHRRPCHERRRRTRPHPLGALRLARSARSRVLPCRWFDRS